MDGDRVQRPCQPTVVRRDPYEDLPPVREVQVAEIVVRCDSVAACDGAGDFLGLHSAEFYDEGGFRAIVTTPCPLTVGERYRIVVYKEDKV